MLKTEELLEGIEEKYHEMLKKVNFVDFTKCVATAANLPLERISNEAIKEYLHTWAKNKFHIFEIFGNQIEMTTDVNVEKDTLSIEQELEDKVYKKYCRYVSLLEELCGRKGSSDYIKSILENKVKFGLSDYLINFFGEKKIKLPCYWDKNPVDLKLTKALSTLGVEDGLINELGSIIENKSMASKYTVSIDPIDIMLASVSKYKWTSCYNLEEGSYRDGCFAAVVDKTTMIGICWTNKDTIFLDNKKYSIKDIKQKRRRHWILLNENGKELTFFQTYPNDDRTANKIFREACEGMIAKQLEITDKWATTQVQVNRVYSYGYDERDRGDFVTVIHETLKEQKMEEIEYYTDTFNCPCGCGSFIHCRETSEDMDEDESYQDGLNCDEYHEEQHEWCDLADRECDSAGCMCSDCCAGCSYYEDNNSDDEEEVEECEDSE